MTMLVMMIVMNGYSGSSGVDVSAISCTCSVCTSQVCDAQDCQTRFLGSC